MTAENEPRTIGDHGGSLDEYRLFLAMRSAGAVFVAFLPEHKIEDEQVLTLQFVAVDMRDRERIGCARSVSHEAITRYPNIVEQSREIAMRDLGWSVAMRAYAPIAAHDSDEGLRSATAVLGEERRDEPVEQYSRALRASGARGQEETKT